MVMPSFFAGQRLRASQVEAMARQIDSLTAPAWTPLTLAASWTNRSGYQAAGYRKIDGGANLQIVLNITGGTQTNGTTIGTLAAGFWPLAKVQLTIGSRIASAPQQLGVIEIDTAGVIKIFDIGASTTIHATGKVPLDH